MIPAERAHLNVTVISHPGMTGKNNEDRYGVSAYFTDAERTVPSLLAVVADGIGGHRAGEVAAELAVETISTHVAETDASQPVQTLCEAIVQAGKVINALAEKDPSQRGMGSTCACAWIVGTRLYIASVGDSRIYLIRNNTIRQLTTDHTWVQEALEHGVITPEEAHNHPNAHVIRRYLGSRLDVVPDVRLRLHPDESDAQAETNQGNPLQPGDVLLLCSDGLTDLVEAPEILAALQTRNTHGALEELVKVTNRRGGHDNVTIVTLAVPVIERPTIPLTVARRTRARVRLAWLLAGVTLLLLGALAGLAGVVWYFGGPNGGAPAVTATQDVQQATLFPAGGTAPAALPPAVGTPAAPATSEGGASASTPGAFTTPPSATLTPWPTNTGGP